MKVCIRADASPAIGSGHLMRCYALAEALVSGGDDILLLTGPESQAQTERWRRLGATVAISRKPAGSAGDAEQTSKATLSAGATWTILDGYVFDESYGRRLSDTARLLVIDDCGTATPSADIINNGNLYASERHYPDRTARLLLGPRYALLRSEFRSASSATDREGVLLSLGGADPEGRTRPLLQALAQAGLTGRVVVGPHDRSATVVHDTANSLGWESIDSPSEMAPLLASCEVAVVGSGSTTLEALALSTPMVAVVTTENQRAVADELDRRGLAIVVEGTDPGGAAAAATWLLADPKRRSALAEGSREIVDGRGAIRVAAAMREALLELRPATLADAALLLAWHNDPVTRAASFSHRLTSPDDHLDWFRAALADSSRTIEIGEVEGRPLGVVRLDRHGGSAVISLTIAPWARSLGMATPLIRRGLERAAVLGIASVEARIRNGNTASRRAFAAAGFAETDRGGTVDDHAVVMVATTNERG